jgi:hypothetical protein
MVPWFKTSKTNILAHVSPILTSWLYIEHEKLRRMEYLRICVWPLFDCFMTIFDEMKIQNASLLPPSSLLLPSASVLCVYLYVLYSYTYIYIVFIFIYVYLLILCNWILWTAGPARSRMEDPNSPPRQVGLLDFTKKRLTHTPHTMTN